MLTGNDIKEARQRRNLSLRDAARAVGIGTATFWRAEQGRPVRRYVHTALERWVGVLDDGLLMPGALEESVATVVALTQLGALAVRGYQAIMADNDEPVDAGAWEALDKFTDSLEKFVLQARQKPHKEGVK